MQIRQVVVTGQYQVELQTVDVSEPQLAPDQLLIETEATFISAGTELANYSGREPKVFQPGQWCTYPWKSGYANVGVVRAVGAGVNRAKAGDRVFTYGNHASMVVYPQDRLVIAVPDGLDSVTAAASRMAGVATTAIVVSELRDNPWVAVFGLGAVGNLAAQAYNILGCRVIGVDPVMSRRELAMRCGIEHAVGGSPEEANQAIMELTKGQGANITVDAVGHSAVVMQALPVTASFGQLVILGSPRVSVQGDLTALLSDVHLRFITIRGALEWNVPIYSGIGKGTSQYSKQERIFDWIQRGKMQVDSLVSHRLQPEEIKQAYDGLLNQPEEYTGVALVWK